MAYQAFASYYDRLIGNESIIGRGRAILTR